jgi:hypothetical protein
VRSDFSILKRKTNTGIRYYIRYAWNQDKGRYSKTLSTDFSTKKQAEKYAKVEVPKLLLHLSIKNEDNPKVSDFLKEAYTPGSLFLQNKINQGKPLEDEYLIRIKTGGY